MASHIYRQSEVTLSACIIATGKQPQTVHVCADSFAPFSRAGASGETGDFSITDLSTRLDYHRGKRLRQFFSFLIRKIYS